MSDIKYIIKRALISVALIFFAASFLFFLFRLMPGDFMTYLAYGGADEATIAHLRAKWGLDKPLYMQYFAYVTNLITGDAGISVQYRRPVLSVVGEALINSAILAAPAITTVYILGAVFGTKIGTSRGKALEKSSIIPLTFVGTLPQFFLAILLLLVFAFWFDLFPTGNMMPITSPANSYGEMFMSVEFWIHYTLPFTTVVLNLLYLPTLTMRTSIVEVLGQDFIEYNRMKGLKQSTQLKHVAKHASLPVITQYPITMVHAISGLVVIEWIFNWPGIGDLLLQSVLLRDYPVLQFIFFLIAVWVILGNFVVDLLYSVIDPRVTVEGQKSK